MEVLKTMSSEDKLKELSCLHKELTWGVTQGGRQEGNNALVNRTNAMGFFHLPH